MGMAMWHLVGLRKKPTAPFRAPRLQPKQPPSRQPRMGATTTPARPVAAATSVQAEGDVLPSWQERARRAWAIDRIPGQMLAK